MLLVTIIMYTAKASNTVITNDTLSPEFGGRMNENRDTMVSRPQGTIKFRK